METVKIEYQEIFFSRGGLKWSMKLVQPQLTDEQAKELKEKINEYLKSTNDQAQGTRP